MLNSVFKNGIRSWTAVLCVALLGAALTPGLKADVWNKKTVVTFSAPVEIPGKVLPAGTYVFKLLDSQSNRNIVQIFDKDETKLFATILAIPDYRLQPTGETVIRFEERAANAPQAIRAWFYPGDQFGQEFVYPKPRAVQLAKETHQNVLSMPAEMEANITKEAKTAQAPSVVAMQNTTVTAQKPSGEEVELSQVVQTHPETGAAPSGTAATQPAQTLAQARPKHLPATGSALPLVGLAGLFSLGNAALLGWIRKRIK
jgi:hypothetical protein